MLRRFRRNNWLPQDTATQRIRYERTLKNLLRVGQQFLAITALLLSATTFKFYIKTRYESNKIYHCNCTVLWQVRVTVWVWVKVRVDVAWSLHCLSAITELLVSRNLLIYSYVGCLCCHKRFECWVHSCTRWLMAVRIVQWRNFNFWAPCWPADGICGPLSGKVLF